MRSKGEARRTEDASSGESGRTAQSHTSVRAPKSTPPSDPTCVILADRL